MSSKSLGVVNKAAPWRSDVRWPIVAIEALVLVGLGLFMLIDSESAGKAVLQIIGLAFLVTSVLLGAGALRNHEGRLGTYDAFRAGIGITVGIIATISWWSDYIEPGAVRLILGWGLVAYSLLQVAGLVMMRERTGFRPSLVVIAVLALVLGIVLLTSNDDVSAGRINALGTVFLLFGAVLSAWAWFLYSRSRGHQAPARVDRR
jgi:uncharacterized membrane protein HdeD (DUF308 family)